MRQRSPPAPRFDIASASLAFFRPWARVRVLSERSTPDIAGGVGPSDRRRQAKVQALCHAWRAQEYTAILPDPLNPAATTAAERNHFSPVVARARRPR